DALDGRDTDDFLGRDIARDRFAIDRHGLAALLDEHNGHRTLEVGTRGPEHLLPAARIELDRNTRAAIRGRRSRVGELIAGDDDASLGGPGDLLPRALIEPVVELRAERRPAAARGFKRVVARIHQPPLERGDLAEDVLDLRGIL